MRKILSTVIVLLLLIGLNTMPVMAQQPDWETAMNRSLDWIYAEVSPGPLVGSVGGEWAVLALARAGRITAEARLLTGWFTDLNRSLEEVDRLTALGHNIQNPPSAGTFPQTLRRHTDFQRVTLALGSLGIDASNYNGRDLTAFFGEFTPKGQRHALNQTVNADIFALIALDSGQFSGDRNQFINSLLNAQRANGVWSLGAAPSVAGMSDADMTAMAIQALAPYYARGEERVDAAVNRALGWLRLQTFSDPESTSQMIVALTALGSEFTEEAAYYVNHLLRWFDTAQGAFRRPDMNSPINMMATEQAAYALVSYWRFRNDMTSLYDMRDVLTAGSGGVPAANNEQTTGLQNRHADVRQIEIRYSGRTFEDIQNHTNRAAIEALTARGIITGRNEIFAPDDTMTRAEFSAIVTRGLGLPAVAEAAAVFGDVESGAWFAGVVGSAFYYEIVRGIDTPAGLTFNPGGTITRQEAAVMAVRAARLAGMETTLTDTETLNVLAAFGDYRTAARWAWNYLAFCYREGILDDADFYIEPLVAITRAEIADMLYRILSRAELI